MSLVKATTRRLFFLTVLLTILFVYCMTRFGPGHKLLELSAFKLFSRKLLVDRQFEYSETTSRSLSLKSVDEHTVVSGHGRTTMKSTNGSVEWSEIQSHTVLGLPGVFVFQDVCVELLPAPIVRELNFYTGSKLRFNETQRIVVYNSNKSVNGSWKRIYTSVTKNTVWNHWDIHFSSSSIPSTHVIKDNSVFFLLETFPGNLHHFWTDEFLALYWTMKTTNRLKMGNRNQLLYRIPTCLSVKNNGSCSYYRNYEAMLKTLYIESFHEAFFRMTPYTCFSSAVFGTTTSGMTNKREAIEHVLQGFDLPIRSLAEAKYVTFILRGSRMLENLEELLNVTREMGVGEVIVVRLEDMPIASQAKMISNSRVLIGVQGAGLQWAMFMPVGSYMIEIAWPKKHWKFFFRDTMKSYGIKAIGIETNEVAVNWYNYEKATRNGVRIPDEERERLIKNPPKETHWNIYKYADCRVNRSYFIEKLNLIKSDIMKTKV